jgi:hypothetical protein
MREAKAENMYRKEAKKNINNTFLHEKLFFMNKIRRSIRKNLLKALYAPKLILA